LLQATGSSNRLGITDAEGKPQAVPEALAFDSAQTALGGMPKM
jgi:hypothetical protein